MPRLYVDAIHHLQPRAFERSEQLIARAKAEMLREIGKNQPPLAAGCEVRRQSAQESIQHAHLAPGGQGWLILSDLAEHLRKNQPPLAAGCEVRTPSTHESIQHAD